MYAYYHQDLHNEFKMASEDHAKLKVKAPKIYGFICKDLKSEYM